MAKYTGISFPFRVGVKGGIVLSTADDKTITHLVESMQQILLTRPLERSMEFEVHSDIDSDIFSPNDVSSHTLIAHQVRKALTELEPRIQVNSVDVVEGEQENAVIVKVYFSVNSFDGEVYSAYMKVGE